MKTQILGENFEVSAVSLGCMGMTHAYSAPENVSEMTTLLKKAVDLGYTMFDTAECYTDVFPDGSTAYNEELLGMLDWISKEKNTTPTCISLAWMINKKPWIVPIPGTRKLSRMEQNFNFLNRDTAARNAPSVPRSARPGQFFLSLPRKKQAFTSAMQYGTWNKERCIVIEDKVQCDNCARPCTSGAIKKIAAKADDPRSLKIPMIDSNRCIGCGACEYLCPSRSNRPGGHSYVLGCRGKGDRGVQTDG